MRRDQIPKDIPSYKDRTLKRCVRNVLAAILGTYLILTGRVKRARDEAFSWGAITAITFHKPHKRLFRRSIRWLKKKEYTFISTDELLEIIREKTPPPRGAVWVTFDDGFKEIATRIVPIIEEEEIPAVFFITTDPIEGDGIFWWSFAYHFQHLLPVPYTNKPDELWLLKEQKRKVIIESLKTKLDVKVARETMTIDELRTISRIRFVTIASHTACHAMITNCTTKQLHDEIHSSRMKLERWIGKEVKYFAYPNGDYDDRVTKILDQNGYELATTTEQKLISMNDDVYFIPRFICMDDGYLAENICHMVGIWTPFIDGLKAILKKRRQVSFV